MDVSYHDLLAAPVRVDLDTRQGRFGGWLEAWISTPTGWDGYVRYSTAPGSTYIAWLASTSIRRLEA